MLFLVYGCFLRLLLGACSIRIFAKNMGDPYYESTIVVHDTLYCLRRITMQRYITQFSVEFKKRCIVCLMFFRKIKWQLFLKKPVYLLFNHNTHYIISHGNKVRYVDLSWYTMYWYGMIVYRYSGIDTILLHMFTTFETIFRFSIIHVHYLMV